MNKKAQATELILILLFILLIGGIAYYVFSASNPYTQFRNDCEKIYSSNTNFTYNSTCQTFNGTMYPCQEINYSKLDELCLNKYSEGKSK